VPSRARLPPTALSPPGLSPPGADPPGTLEARRYGRPARIGMPGRSSAAPGLGGRDGRGPHRNPWRAPPRANR